MEKLPTSSKALRYLPFLVASAFFMQMLDATILNTAIPTIARSFNSHPLQLHSLVTAYMLTVCVLIPASGWISDKLGSRRTFLFAISVFSAGSLLCALSTSVAMMTACRVIQGIGGAFLMPVGRLVVLRSYPRSMFVNVLNIVTIPALLGPLLGPVLGGIIVQYASWHWIFLINIPVGIAGLWATWKLMPDLKAVREQKFDWAGFFLFSSPAVLVTMGLSTAGGAADKTRMALLLSAGGVFQLLYWVLAFRSKAPIFSPSLFRIRNFAIGIAGNIVCRLGGSCLPYLIPLFFQVVLGYSALQSGMSLIPLALSNLLGFDEGKFKITTGVAGGIGTLLASFGLLNAFQGFLSLMSALIPPLAGVIIAAYWITGKGKKETFSFQPGFSAAGLIAFIVGALAACITGGTFASFPGLVQAAPFLNTPFFMGPVNGIVVSLVLYVILAAVLPKKKA